MHDNEKKSMEVVKSLKNHSPETLHNKGQEMVFPRPRIILTFV